VRPVGLTAGRVLRSEWIKLSTLRSTKIAFAAAALLYIGGAVVMSWDTVGKFGAMTAADRADVAVEGRVLVGRLLADLAVGVLGVMTIAGEYATGAIRASLAAVPRRLPVLWAKLGMLAGVTLVAMTAASFASFFAGNAILSEHWDFSLADPGVLRSVLGAATALTFVCMFGLLIGFIVRTVAGAISILFAILLVVPTIVDEISASLAAHLPTGAMSSLVTAKIEAPMIEPLPALALLAGYLALALAGAAWTLVRRDA
jgi:ABC-2 type transport system permease protein